MRKHVLSAMTATAVMLGALGGTLPAYASQAGASQAGASQPDVVGDGGYAGAGLSSAHGAVPQALSAAIAQPSGYPVNGIDVSGHDWDDGKTLDWPSLAGTNDFAYVKATEGTTFVNAHYSSDTSAGKAAGLAMGAYAFARPDLGDPAGQADHFVDTMAYRHDGKSLPPFLDLEWPYSQLGLGTCYGLSTSAMTSWISSFLSEVESRLGVVPMIYTNVNWWNPCTGSSSAFSHYLLDISSCTSSPPSVPGWGTNWTFWQYSIPGCDSSRPHDVDVYRGSLADLAVLAGGTPARAAPTLGYDQGDGTMRMYRWTSDGSSFTHTTDYDSGAFQMSNVGDRMASGDVDGDGKDDVVMAYQLSDGTFAFYVWKSGTGAAQVWYTSGSFDLSHVAGRLVLGDFNGDGKAEPALVYDNGDRTMRIYRWLSTGTGFTRTTDYNSGTFPLSNVGDRVAAGDVDGDGKDDIVMAYQLSDGTFSFYVWKGGAGAAQVWYTSGPFGLANVAGRLVVGDFNGDGKAEPALVYDNGDQTMRIYRWVSSGTGFTHTTDYNSGTFPLSNVGDRVAAGDIDGDGTDDIVMAYQLSDGTFSFYTWKGGLGPAQVWYTSGPFGLANVGGRLVLGAW